MRDIAEQERIPLCASLSFSSDPQTELLSALQQDKLDVFQRVLEQGEANVNHIYGFPVFNSCVHLAAKSDRKEFLELLLNSGADANLWNPFKKNTPLMCAIEKLNLEFVTLLLEHGAHTSIKDDRGRVALHWVVVHSARNPSSSDQAVAIGKELLKRSDCDINAQDNARYTPLRIALESGQDDLSRLLVSNGAETVLPGPEAGDISTTDLVKGNGIEEDSSLNLTVIKHKNYANLLYESLVNRDLIRFRTHLKEVSNNKDVLNVFHGQHTCLTYACFNNLEDFVSELLSAGADPVACDSFSKISPIHYTALNGNLSILKLIIGVSPAAVSYEDMNEHTILHKLALGSNSNSQQCDRYIECLKYLESQRESLDIDVNRQDKIGCTPLHYSLHKGTIGFTKQLLKMGANIGVKNVFGDTPIKDIPVEVFSDFLDDSIKSNGKDMFEKDLKIEFDYRFLAPVKAGKDQDARVPAAETDSLWYLSNSKRQFHLLKHPVIASFIMLKWQKIKMIFYVNLIFYVLFTVILLSHIFFNVLGYFDSGSTVNSGRETEDDHSDGSNSELLRFRFLFILTVISVTILSFREMFQFLLAPRRYMCTVENLLELSLICMTFFILFYSMPRSSCIALCAFSILLTLTELFLLMGRLPKFSIYVKMFTTVMLRFTSFLLWYSVLIAAFVTSMHVLFRQNEAFDSFGSSLIKILVMSVGEMDYGAFPVAGSFPSGRIIFVAFLFLISVVLMNLLNGLAVSDTVEIQDKARVYSLMGFVDVICYFESMMLGDPFELLSGYPPFKWLRVVPDCYPIRCILNSGTFLRIRYYLIERSLLFPRILPNKLIGFYPNVNNGTMDKSTSMELFYLDDEILQDARNILVRHGDQSGNLRERLTKVEEKIDRLIDMLQDRAEVSSGNDSHMK